MKKNANKIFAAVLLAVVALPGLRAATGEEDNANLDELGQMPEMRLRFDGNLDSSGVVECNFDKRYIADHRKKGMTFVPSRAGEKTALKLGDGGFFPYVDNVPMSDEWSIVVVAKGVDRENAIILSSGTARRKGSRAFGLVGTGKGGVKLVQWWGSSNEQKLLAMKDVIHFDKQFHTYSIVYSGNGEISLWVDGKKAGESKEFESNGLVGIMDFGAFHWSMGGGCALGEGVEIAEWRFYETALAEAQLLQIAGGNEPWPEGLPTPKEKISAFVDTNSVLRLGYEIPADIKIGTDGERRLYAKGVLAQCGIGPLKRFELAKGGLFAIGAEGFVFDSNYAKARTNEVVFSGGALAAFEPSYMKSAAPIKLSGDVKLMLRERLIVRASFEGDGNIEKSGSGLLALQYPCENATGTLTVSKGALVLGPVGSWAGTVKLEKGTELRCPSLSAIGNLVKDAGAKVVELGTSARGDMSKDVFPQPATAYNLKKMQKERMGRGVFALRQTEDEVMVGWRYKSTDPTNIAFNVYGNGVKLNSSPISDVTYFRTPWKGMTTKYEVRGVSPAGKEYAYPVSSSWTLKADAPVGYFDIELTPPSETLMPDGTQVKHFPCDCSIGDLDGDGEYDLVIIWWPMNGADNSSWHKTGDAWIEGVKLDGTNRSLWKINLGPNIRAGSHYLPVMVCDMDGDGKAEVVCRTADNTRDGTGKRLGTTDIDWRAIVPGAHILWARNYITVFDGATGAAIDTVSIPFDVLSDAKLRAEAEAVAMKPDSKEYKDKNAGYERAINREWSSRNPGNQAFRMLGAVAYLDGVHPSVVMCRGYYSRTCLMAYDFDGKKLKERWLFCSDDQRWWGYGGQGFHNLRVGDVDFDGKDEIIYGHMIVDHNGEGLHTTGMGHGDAIHLIQASPETRGLQVWTCHEASPFGVSLWDAQSGRLHFWTHGPQDTGSCNALDIDPKVPGVELFSGAHCGIYSAANSQRHMNPKPNPKDNYYGMLRFGIWWKGDMTRSAYSGGTKIKDYSIKGRSVSYIHDVDPIDEEKGEEHRVHANHGTKGCPNLIADIFGDWREEIMLTRNDNKAIRVYMSNFDTPYRFWTFLEDPIYRISVLTQNNGYNVPTDPGFYFGPDLLGHGIWWRGTFLK